MHPWELLNRSREERGRVRSDGERRGSAGHRRWGQEGLSLLWVVAGLPADKRKKRGRVSVGVQGDSSLQSLHSAVIAECYQVVVWVAEERRGHSQAGIGERGRGDCRQRCRAGLTALGGWSLRDTASLCQLANFSVCRLFDLLACWEVGELAG